MPRPSQNGPERDSPPGGGQDHAGTPRPDALIPALDEGQLAALREVGREWDRVSADPQVWRQALPVDPSLGEYPGASQVRPGRFTRFVPVAGQDGQLPPIQTTSVSETPPTPLGRAGQALKRLVFGPPLDATAIAVERMRKLVALPVLSADALSSVAYGPQAMLAVLVLAGLPGLSYSLPVGAAIMVLMLAVGISYRQTIRAYPQGGGSYIVASEELGRVPGLMAAAGLLIDYVMTVAVSIASGVAAITSAYPSVRPATVWIGVGVIVILLAGNLRGVRQAGTVFAVPTYAFIAAIAALVVAGLVHAAGRGFHPVPVRHLATVQAVTLLLVLRAFASGSTAMTGIEAISNAVPSFEPVEWRNARITLSWMIGLLIAMFGGVLVITRLAGIVPVASQTGAVLSGLVFVIEGVTKFTAGAWVAIVLITAITVTALRTRRYYVRTGQQLALRADQAATPAALPAKVAPRPPSTRPARGPEGGAAPGPGAESAEQPGQVNALTIVPVEVMDRAGLQALAYAAALGQPAFALHISPTAEEADRFLGYWRAWGDHLPLEVIVSPHRALVAPLVNYLWALHEQRPDLTLTVAVPELVDRHWWHRIMHEHVADRLQPALQSLPRVVVTSVPFHLAD